MLAKFANNGSQDFLKNLEQLFSIRFPPKFRKPRKKIQFSSVFLKKRNGKKIHYYVSDAKIFKSHFFFVFQVFSKLIP